MRKLMLRISGVFMGLVLLGSMPLLAVVGWHFLFKIIHDVSKDAVVVTNASFVILGSLAALSFAWLSTFGKSVGGRALLRQVGEGFFHSAFLMLLASIFKYTAISMYEVLPAKGFSLQETFSHLLQLASAVLFGVAFSEAFFSAFLLSFAFWTRMVVDKSWWRNE